MTKCKLAGFTLIELIAVIVLLGIVSLSATSMFSRREGFSEYALRDEIKAAIRFAQQRAMYDNDPSAGNCYSFAWDSSSFGPRKNGTGAGFANYLGSSGVVALSGDYAGISLSPGAGVIYFDELGNALSDSCSGTASATSLTLSSGASSLTLNVFPTGYVQTP